MHRTEALGVAVFLLIVILGAAGILAPEKGRGAELILRVGAIYFLLTLGFRALGKRELSQLSPFELVTVLLVAEIVSPALTAGDESVPGAVIGTATLLFLTFLNSAMTYRWHWFRALGEASPAVIIRDGKLTPDALHRNRLRPDEIASEMHKSGITDIEQIRWAILEPDGQLAFIRKDEAETSPPEGNAAL